MVGISVEAEVSPIIVRMVDTSEQSAMMVQAEQIPRVSCTI